MTTYLREAYLLPSVASVPVIIVLLILKQWFVPHNYLGLAVHFGIAGLVYGLALLWAFKTTRAMKVGNLHAHDLATQ